MTLSNSRALAGALLALGLAAAAPQIAQAKAAVPLDVAAWAKLPDWSGQWVVIPETRPAPPYNAEWAAKQKEAAAQVRAGKLANADTICGLPYGNPWMLGVPDTHEWIVRPETVWHNIENSGVTSRIYTDGRPHLMGDDIFPTYTGDSIGKWEGDTLVADTVGFQDDTWLGPGALIHSDQLHLTQRIRKTAPDRMEVRLTADDPVAFTKPWEVTYRYRKLPVGTLVREYACKILRNPGE
jgi:hypothetical protein